MQFKVTKIITAKSGKYSGWMKILFILLLLPLLALFLAALVIFIPIFILNSLLNKKKGKAIVAHEGDGIFLAGNDKVSIRLVRDEKDPQFDLITKAWITEVFSGRVPVYRASTNPRIEGLHDQFITYFFKENQDGVFLQLVNVNEHGEQKISTRLVFLNYHDLTLGEVANVGPYMLFTDKKSAWLVRGYNNNHEIELSLTFRND